jgi:hypothetical protein
MTRSAVARAKVVDCLDYNDARIDADALIAGVRDLRSPASPSRLCSNCLA